MAIDDSDQIRIQILATKDVTGTRGRALAAVQEHREDVADIARELGIEALLVSPSPEQYDDDRIALIICTRFRQGLDEDTVFWRQHDLAREMHRALKVDALVVNLDFVRLDFLKHVEDMLISPYSDELGRRIGADAQPNT